MEQKKSKVYIAIFALLFLVVFGFCGYIIYDKLNEKKVSKESNEKSSNINDVTNVVNDLPEETNEKTDNKKDIIKGGEELTEEEARTFLNDLVSDSLARDLLIAETDETIFINAITYLTFNKKYTKDGNNYIFSQKDISDIAYKYYMRNNFNYISNDKNFVYDSANQTYSSGLNFDLSSPGPSYVKTRTMSDFNFADGVASVTYTVKIVYDSTQLANPDDNVTIRNYKIKIVKDNGILRISDISLK